MFSFPTTTTTTIYYLFQDCMFLYFFLSPTTEEELLIHLISQDTTTDAFFVLRSFGIELALAFTIAIRLLRTTVGCRSEGERKRVMLPLPSPSPSSPPWSGAPNPPLSYGKRRKEGSRKKRAKFEPRPRKDHLLLPVRERETETERDVMPAERRDCT